MITSMASSSQDHPSLLQGTKRGQASLTRVGLLAVGLLALTQAGCTSLLPQNEVPIATRAARAKVPPATKERVLMTRARLPLTFEANRGQTDARVKFLSRGSGYTLFLTSTEAVMVLSKLEPEANSNPDQSQPGKLGKRTATVLRMELVGANPHAQAVGLEELRGKSNYLIGRDPSRWHTGIPHYARVKYTQVYPGIDLVYYGNQRKLEYDLVVAPGADPTGIRIAFEGADKLTVDGRGDLVLHTGAGEVRLKKPVVYQEVNDTRKEIAGSYVLLDPDTSQPDSGLRTPDSGLGTQDSRLFSSPSRWPSTTPA